MRVFHYLLLMGCLTGCEMISPAFDTSSKTLSVSAGQAELQSSTICCESLTTLPFVDITKDMNQDFVFDHTAPAYQFSSGKSFVRAFRLPLNSDAMAIEVSSSIKENVFVPTVDFYNPSMQLVKRLQPSDFVYKPARMIQGDTLEARFIVTNLTAADAKKIAFMLIYTTDEAQQGETKVIHPAKQFAKASGTVPPNIADPLIPHAATGTVTVQVTMNNSGENIFSALQGPLFGESDTVATPASNTQGEQLIMASPLSNTKPMASAVNSANQVGSVVTMSAATTSAQAGVATGVSMLAETEHLYNQLIEKAVSAGDIEKAMQLATEAERAGSKSAKNTLVNAIKRTQK